MTTLSPLTRGMLWAMLGAKILGAWGLRWDIQWHLRIGRDSFWIAPHLIPVAHAPAFAANTPALGVTVVALVVTLAAALGGAAGGTRLARVVEP